MDNRQKDELKKKANMLKLCDLLNIKLKKSGNASYIGRCPFPDHEDKNPSFSVNADKGLYHCFGCSKKGDQITLVSELKSCSFNEALEFLDERFNGGRFTSLVSNKSESSAKTTTEKSNQDQLNRQALLSKVVDHYHNNLKDNDKAIDYLKKRGIYSEELINEFKIGFSNRRDLNNLISKEERDALIELGIIKNNPNKTEHFSNCVTFPILSADDLLLECYGRKIRDRQSEGIPSHLYLKGPHKGVFNEQAFLYDEITVCESIIDAMTFMANNIMNVTASFGTNGFTEDHIKLLGDSKVKKLIIAYDNDQGGDKGAERLIDIVKSIDRPIEIKRVVLPRDADINEYALTVAPEQRSKMLNKLINESITFYMPEAKKKAADLVKTDKELIMRRANRIYRIRGVENNNSVEHLRVNLKLIQDKKFHLDVLDLFSAKQRIAFVKQAAIILELDQNTLFNDMALLVEQTEILNDNRIAACHEDEFDEEYQMSPEEEAQALRFLTNPDLIRELLEDFENMGFVGEQENKLVVYFCSMSCKMDKPLSVMIISRSSAGKSALQDAALGFMAKENKVKFTQMTDQSLFYMKDGSIKNKVLAISESEGAQGAFYAIKTMQSEGELNIASTGKDMKSGRMQTHHYHVDGPVALILTTTAVELDEEVANRFINVTVDESCEQTQRIQQQQRFEKTLEGKTRIKLRPKIALKHQNAARLLRPLIVVNPFANHLTFLINRLRARRDNDKYLSLIEAITFVFQYQRQVKLAPAEMGGFEYIETTVEDIKLANRFSLSP